MADHFCGPSRSESLYLLTLSIQCMAHAYLCGELQSLIQPLHIRFAIKRLDVTNFCRPSETMMLWRGIFTSRLQSESQLKPFFSPTLDLHRRLK
jgi:hypothetical protein